MKYRLLEDIERILTNTYPEIASQTRRDLSQPPLTMIEFGCPHPVDEKVELEGFGAGRKAEKLSLVSRAGVQSL